MPRPVSNSLRRRQQFQSCTCVWADPRTRIAFSLHLASRKPQAAINVILSEARDLLFDHKQIPRFAQDDTMTMFTLYNSLTRSIDPFAPADGKTALIYS